MTIALIERIALKLRATRPPAQLLLVSRVGDWLDVRSLQACYQLVDAETLYAVVTEPRKLRKKALANLNNTVHNTVHERS